MIFFRRSATTENYREFRRIFNAIKQISTRETLQEVDMLSGYFYGVVMERRNAGKLTKAQQEALLEMVDAKQEERREQLEDEEDGEEYLDDETPQQIVNFSFR